MLFFDVLDVFSEGGVIFEGELSDLSDGVPVSAWLYRKNMKSLN